LRRQHQDAARMGVLILLRVVAELEAAFLGQLDDLLLFAGQEVPTVGSAGKAVRPDLSTLFRRGQLRLLTLIETDRDDGELLADAEPLLAGKLAQAFRQAVEHQVAEHRTAILHQHENYRTIAIEIVAQPDGPSVLVAEAQARGNLLLENGLELHI